jgi:hypothetical protein
MPFFFLGLVFGLLTGAFAAFVPLDTRDDAALQAFCREQRSRPLSSLTP